MINETLRLASAWLQHGTYGINAQLDAVPRDGGDAQPADITVFQDESQHTDAALGRVPETVPAIVITCESAAMLNDQVARDVGDGEVVLNLRLFLSDVDAQDAKRDASYYLRALQWCVRKWVQQAPDATTRAQNSVAILEFGRMEFNSLYETVQDRIVAGGARMVCVVRDYGLT
jgi:hypothetical protein